MTYKQPSHRAVLESSSVLLVTPETVVRAATHAAARVGKLAIQGKLLMTAPFLIRPIMNKPSLYPQYTPTLIPQMVLPLKCSQRSLHSMISLPDNALLMRLSANALVIPPPELVNAWRELDHAIANHLFGMSPQEYEKCRTEATEQFYAIVAYRRKVRDATKASHPSQTAAQHSNRPQRSAPERLFSPQDAAAGEYVVRPKLPKTPKKLDY